MTIENSMLAQGTKIRVASLIARTGTVSVADGTATVTGVTGALPAVGDRILVGTEPYAVVASGESTFSFLIGEQPAPAAGPLSFKTYLDIDPKTFGGPGGSASIIDSTTLGSVAKRKRTGLRDEGQLTFTINYLNSNAAHQALRAYRAANTRAPIELEFSDGVVWSLSGFVLSFQLSGAVDGLVEASVGIEIDGEITEL